MLLIYSQISIDLSSGNLLPEEAGNSGMGYLAWIILRNGFLKVR